MRLLYVKERKSKYDVMDHMRLLFASRCFHMSHVSLGSKSFFFIYTNVRKLDTAFYTKIFSESE